MIGKTITGKSFGGCVRYIVDKQEAKILAAEGVRMQNAASLIQDFNMQRKIRPGLGKAVGHIVLSWSKEDLAKLSNEVMVENAKAYMQKMGIRDTQYVIVRHHDREHPHLHLVYNRVDNKGDTITDKNDYARNIKACKEITLKNGYHIGEGKQQVNRQALRGKEKLRYELYDAIKAAIKPSKNWKELEANLQRQGIRIDFKYKGQSNEVQGVSFEKGELKMKGSAIDRCFSFGDISKQLDRNLQIERYHTAVQSHKPALASQLKEVIRQDVRSEYRHTPDMVKGILDALLQEEFVGAAPDPIGDAEIARRKRKKHEAQRAQLQGISR